MNNQTGWSCPKCHGVMSPIYPTCFYCKPSETRPNKEYIEGSHEGIRRAIKEIQKIKDKYAALGIDIPDYVDNQRHPLNALKIELEILIGEWPYGKQKR